MRLHYTARARFHPVTPWASQTIWHHCLEHEWLIQNLLVNVFLPVSTLPPSVPRLLQSWIMFDKCTGESPHLIVESTSRWHSRDLQHEGRRQNLWHIGSQKRVLFADKAPMITHKHDLTSLQFVVLVNTVRRILLVFRRKLFLVIQFRQFIFILKFVTARRKHQCP